MFGQVALQNGSYQAVHIVTRIGPVQRGDAFFVQLQVHHDPDLESSSGSAGTQIEIDPELIAGVNRSPIPDGRQMDAGLEQDQRVSGSSHADPVLGYHLNESYPQEAD
jgi:hypothetical protein